METNLAVKLNFKHKRRHKCFNTWVCKILSQQRNAPYYGKNISSFSK